MCSKWLRKAPVWRGGEQDLVTHGQQARKHIAGMRARAEMLQPWVEEIEPFVTECARSVAIGGGFPGEGRFRFGADIPTAEMKRLRNIPHEKAIYKTNTDGDFYEDCAGSVFRKDRTGSFIVVIWTFEGQGSGG